MSRSGPPGRPVRVVIVAYGAADLLDECLASLGGGPPVLIVDNSSDAAVRSVASRRGVGYVDPGANLGFAGGVNLGLESRGDDDVLLVNPDAAVTPDEIERLSRCLHAEDRLACVAPVQVSPTTGAPERVAWPFPTPAGAWVDAVGLGRLRRREDFLIGSVLLLRSEALDDVGRFDERFHPLYAEETDWQRRAWQRGWTVRLCPDARATHVGAGTGGDATAREVHFHAAQERYIRKHHGSAGWAVYRAAALTGAAGRALVRRGEGGRSAAARARLYWRGPERVERALADGSPAARAAAEQDAR
jgi:GT2 family glycosyltransferase